MVDVPTDPIRALIDTSSVPVGFIAPGAGGGGYDPDSSSDFTPPADVAPVTIRGNWEFDTQEGEENAYSGTLIVHADDVPSRPVAGQTRWLIDDQTFNTAKVRRRVFGGVTNGYTCTVTL